MTQLSRNKRRVADNENKEADTASQPAPTNPRHLHTDRNIATGRPRHRPVNHATDEGKSATAYCEGPTDEVNDNALAKPLKLQYFESSHWPGGKFIQSRQIVFLDHNNGTAKATHRYGYY